MFDDFAPTLNRHLDWEALACAFRNNGRVQIKDFLETTSAVALHSALKKEQSWREVINSGEKVFELSIPNPDNFDATQRAKLDSAIFEGAKAGFQFRFQTIRIPDSAMARKKTANICARFAEFLCSVAVLNFFRNVTGQADIAFVDAQATRYSPGHFLTAHDDDIPGKSRAAAYVFGLTPIWSPDWGGLLLFHDDDLSCSALVPGFNVLNLFAVPQTHSVSMITPFAKEERLSVTGWLRLTEPPA